MNTLFPGNSGGPSDDAQPAHAVNVMRIGFLVHRFPVLSEGFITGLAAGLVARGHDLTMLAQHPSAPGDAAADAGPLAEGLAHRTRRPAADAPILPLPVRGPKALAGLAGLALREPGALRGTLAEARMLRAAGPFDIVHCQFATLGLAALRHLSLGTLRTRRLVVHARGSDITSFVTRRGTDVYAPMFRRADLIVANCDHFRQRVIALGCPAGKVIVIGSPTDTAFFAPPSQRPAPDGRAIRLLAVGRLVEKKGFHDAIAAVAGLRAQGRDVSLDILGDGPLRADLQDQIDREHLEGTVRLCGHASHAQIRDALHRADIFLAPSVRAANGDEDAALNTLKEAMATELPVIATRHGGIPELVVPDENGCLVPERDPAALSRAIVGLIDAPDAAGLRSRFGRAGRARVVAQFDRRVIVTATETAYQSILSQ